MQHVFSIAVLSLVAAACDRSGHDADTTSEAAEHSRYDRDEAQRTADERSAAADGTSSAHVANHATDVNTATGTSPANGSNGGASSVAQTGMGGQAGHGGHFGHAGRPGTPTGTTADNTRINERDRNLASTLSPLDQGNSEVDRTITQRVRQGIVGRDDLSMTAENVKIITVDGIVTLRGPVKTSEEKSTIDKIARQVSGVTRVDNQLEVVAR